MEFHVMAFSKTDSLHWNENIVISMKFSSLAALEVVILTTSTAASDVNFIKMETFTVQCYQVDTLDKT